MDFSVSFYQENGQGNVTDNYGNKVMQYEEMPTFRLSNLNSLQKLIQHKYIESSGLIENGDIVMKEPNPKTERHYRV